MDTYYNVDEPQKWMKKSITKDHIAHDLIQY